MTAKERRLKAKIDEKLDQALRDTFPASDPVSFLEPVPAKDADRKLSVVEAAKGGEAPRTAKEGRQEAPDDPHRA
jgi:hypothetical protein